MLGGVAGVPPTMELPYADDISDRLVAALVACQLATDSPLTVEDHFFGLIACIALTDSAISAGPR